VAPQRVPLKALLMSSLMCSISPNLLVTIRQTIDKSYNEKHVSLLQQIFSK
jgi:hypothetical protein